MKKIIFITIAILILSCSTNHGKKVKCKVVSVKSEYLYGGLTNEKSYSIVTDRGYKIITRTHVEVGDSIDVIVIDRRKKH
jgi:hypothetical protein